MFGVSEPVPYKNIFDFPDAKHTHTLILQVIQKSLRRWWYGIINALRLQAPIISLLTSERSSNHSSHPMGTLQNVSGNFAPPIKFFQRHHFNMASNLKNAIGA